MSTTANYHEAVPVADRGHTLSPRPHSAARISTYFFYKGFVDRPLAALLLIPALPVIGLLCLLVRATSAGPGLYRQRRVGLRGQDFDMLKLRSMRQDAEAASGAVWCVRHDPRITWLGALLRKLHLDELPQLFNVLKGEMSLVGPRPERPEFVEVLSDRLDGYRQRLAVRPGITGLAQVNLPPDTDLASVARKLVLDLEYIERANLWLEIRLLLCTASRIVKISTTRPLGLKRTVKLADAADGLNGSAATPAALETACSADMAAETVRHPAHGDGSHCNGHAERHSRPWSPR